MSTLYVFDNELLGDYGDKFDAALIDTIICDTDIDCLKKFLADYNSNDYSCSFTTPAIC